MWVSKFTNYDAFEMDEIHWFIGSRKKHENGVNMYVMTMMSREPRQIVGFMVDKSVCEANIQQIVYSTQRAKNYYTDGWRAYKNVDYYPGRLKQNFKNKNDTHLIESTNSDLRHYIPGLRRRSKIFYRTKKTFAAVLSVFINAYNKFGEWKYLNPDRTFKSVFDFL